MTRNLIAICLWMLTLLASIGSAHAAARASLDRNQVALGESVALTIETDDAMAVPDLSPLAGDFGLSGQASNRQMQMGPGGVTTRTTHVVNLTPRREGRLAIPSLRVGSQRTAPLVVSVDAAPAAVTSRGNARVFLETEVDDASPYVQQSVGVTVRLFYAVPLVSGQLDLDTPQGASLQRIGEDVQSSREVGGRRYNVVERRFLLVPERSGPLTIPAPRFAGRGAGGWMDDFLGGNSRELQAAGSRRELRVKPQPADAPQPWLPLRDLRLRYVAAPQDLRAGEAASLVVEAVAEGATQAQMPELPTPSVPGAQVFAEPPQFDETFFNGSPQVKLTRRYSIVPNNAGPLLLPGLKLGWWDVRGSVAKVAALPDLKLEVVPGSGGFADAAMPDADAAARATGDDGALTLGPPGSDGSPKHWMGLTALFAALWLLTLLWALGRRHAPVAAAAAPRLGHSQSLARPTHAQADLKRALDTGDLDEVAEVLRGMATPPAADLDALQTALAEPAQRHAIDQLRRARWADGDGVEARSLLRAAFGRPPVWKSRTAPTEELLPPLYPPA